MDRKMVCIQCPLSCRVSVAHGQKVTGNLCPRGRDYALQELTNPTRSLTTTVRTIFPDFPRLPVRTSGEISRKSIFSVMQVLNRIQVEKRMTPGEVVLEIIPGTGVSLIATDDMSTGRNPNEQAAACH